MARASSDIRTLGLLAASVAALTLASGHTQSPNPATQTEAWAFGDLHIVATFALAGALIALARGSRARRVHLGSIGLFVGLFAVAVSLVVPAGGVAHDAYAIARGAVLAAGGGMLGGWVALRAPLVIR